MFKDFLLFFDTRWPQNYNSQDATVHHARGASRRGVYGGKIDFGVKIRLYPQAVNSVIRSAVSLH